MKTSIQSGIDVERIDSYLITYTVHSATIEIFKVLQEAAINNLLSWPKDRPCLIVHDISHPGLGLLYYAAVKEDIFNVGILPEARPQVEEILVANPDWNVVLALIVSSSFSLSGRLYKSLFTEQFPDSSVQAKAFFQRDTGINWLNSLYA